MRVVVPAAAGGIGVVRGRGVGRPYDQSDADPHGTPVLFVFKLVRDAQPPQSGEGTSSLIW